MRALRFLAASLFVLLAGCRSRLPVDRPPTDLPTPAPAPAAALQQVRVEYYQISDG